MKYCSQCGNPMEDDMSFCQKCGTKFVPIEETKKEQEQPDAYNEIKIQPNNDKNIKNTAKAKENQNSKTNTPRIKTRKGMLALSIICFIYVVVFFAAACNGVGDVAIISLSFAMLIFGVMFAVLAKTPKNSKGIGRQGTGVNKKIFVAICCAVAVITVSFSATMDANNQNNTTNNQTKAGKAATTLDDVEEWYQDEQSKVNTSFLETSNSKDNVSKTSITESKFNFGEDDDWCLCDYTVYFKCTYKGKECTGEARGFLEYEGTQVDWYYYEIFDDNWKTVIEENDDTYDEKIEDYYKELVKKYD